METIKNFFARLDLIRVMTAATVLLAFYMIGDALINKVIPAENKEILIHMLGIVEGAVMTIVGYEFGASKGPRKETDTPPTPEKKEA